MSKQTISAISIIPLLLGSILLLAAGSGLVPPKYTIATGLVCLLVFVFIEVILRKKTTSKTT